MSTDIGTPEGPYSVWRRVAASGAGGKVLAVLFFLGAAISLVGLADMADVGMAGSAIALVAAAVQAGLLCVVARLSLPAGAVTRDEIIWMVLWGAFGATGLAGVLNGLGPGAVIAPFAEELIKLAAVIAVLVIGVRTPLRGLALGFTAGAGFEVFENLQYAISPDDGGLGVAQELTTIASRMLVGFGFHAFTVAVTGAVAGYVLCRFNTLLRYEFAVAVLGAVVIHAVWDLAPSLESIGYVLMVIDYVLLVALFVVTVRRVRRA
ncbi:PrsW family intramembrane metalloprotease [Dietzia aerolata]|uniref:PrsW family glutamic-type intramembrane protease n=1 Tax=Dietzia aerolata TaxID=595984 RepID=A0ABV5JS50_9ACTN|nr:PrsW family glutamic-type intramembrane protease [Dietzia aerolata]MBB0968267.1 PrsW family intramembrane metalloprotease [Dietzia aerolata]